MGASNRMPKTTMKVLEDAARVLTTGRLKTRADVVSPSAPPPLASCAVGVHARDYQTLGRDFLYTNKRAMITDAPGLGKTPQGALAAVPPAIVVCPTYLVGQWASWLEEHLPTTKVAVARGDRWAKMKVLDAIGDESLKADFLIVNKEMLRTHLPKLMQIARRFNTLIIDEAHHMRNYRAETSKGALKLAQIIERCYLLTATPIWREVDDLYMMFKLLHPEMFGSYAQFIKTWCNVDYGRFGPEVYGVRRDMREQLEEVLDVLRIGRSYKDAGRELPATMETPVRIDFDDHMAKMYKDAVENFRLQFAGENGEDLMLMSNSAVMHTLRQLTGYHGKVDTVVDLLEEAAPYTNYRAVVFVWYKDLANAIHEALAEKDVDSVVITGEMKAEDRRKAADGSKVVIATIAALSEGVDLSWARHVVFAEKNWTPGSDIQSLARVIRERQTSTDSEEDAKAANEEPVLVHYVMVRGTIDETIYKVSRRRGATIKDVLKEALGFA